MQPNVLDMYHGDNDDYPIDFTVLATAGIWGVMHKVSQGPRYKDPKFNDRIKAASDAGLCIGGYHYLDASDTKSQVENFLSACAASKHETNDFAFAADYEKSADGGHPTLSQLYEFMSAVDKEIGNCLTWTYSSNLIRETLKPLVGGHSNQDMIGVRDFFAAHPLWLAEYGPHENIPYPWNEAKVPPFLWQYSETGRVPHVLGNMDLNFFAGTRDELKAQWRTGGKGLRKASGRGVMPDLAFQANSAVTADGVQTNAQNQATEQARNSNTIVANVGDYGETK